MQVDFACEEFDGRPEEETVMYNLVGHELAKLIEECDGLARDVLGMKAEGEDEDVLHRYFERTVRMKVQGFSWIRCHRAGHQTRSAKHDARSNDWLEQQFLASAGSALEVQFGQINSPLDASSSIEVQATSNSCCDSQCFLKKSVRWNVSSPNFSYEFKMIQWCCGRMKWSWTIFWWDYGWMVMTRSIYG